MAYVEVVNRFESRLYGSYLYSSNCTQLRPFCLDFLAVRGQPIAIELIGDVVNESDRVVCSCVGVVVKKDTVYVKVEIHPVRTKSVTIFFYITIYEDRWC